LVEVKNAGRKRRIISAVVADKSLEAKVTTPVQRLQHLKDFKDFKTSRLQHLKDFKDFKTSRLQRLQDFKASKTSKTLCWLTQKPRL
jgi:hypothetical protein